MKTDQFNIDDYVNDCDRLGDIEFASQIIRECEVPQAKRPGRRFRRATKIFSRCVSAATKNFFQRISNAIDSFFTFIEELFVFLFKASLVILFLALLFSFPVPALFVFLFLVLMGAMSS